TGAGGGGGASLPDSVQGSKAQNVSGKSLPEAQGRGEGETEDSPEVLITKNQTSKPQNPLSPWNLYYRVTLPDAIQLGLLDLINRVQGTTLEPEQFIASARGRSGSEEIFQQSYMCNPLGSS